MTKREAIQLAIDALRHQLGEAEDNLYRWHLQNRQPYYRDEEAEAHWQKKVDDAKSAIAVLNEL